MNTSDCDTIDHRRRYLIVALLVALTMIATADKTIFSFAGVSIIRDLKISPTQYGLAGSIFFLLFSITGVAVGFAANRFSTKTLLIVLSVWWIACQLAMVFVESFAMLLVCRVLLGAGTGPSTPVIQHAVFKWYPPAKRALPAAFVQCGLMGGVICAAFGLPIAISTFGWRSGYIALAAFGAIWLVLWLAFGREGTVGAAAATNAVEQQDGSASVWSVLRSRTFIGMTLMGFVGYMPNALAFSWTAVYFQKGLGFDLHTTGLFVVVTSLCVIPASLLCSAVSQRIIERRQSMRVATVVLPVTVCMVGGASYALAGLGGFAVWPKVFLVNFAALAINILPAFGLTVVGNICGTSIRGGVLAVHTSLITLAGLVAPYMTGRLIDAVGGNVGAGYEGAITIVGIAVLLVGTGVISLVDPDRTRTNLHCAARRWRADSRIAWRTVPISSFTQLPQCCEKLGKLGKMAHDELGENGESDGDAGAGSDGDGRGFGMAVDRAAARAARIAAQTPLARGRKRPASRLLPGRAGRHLACPAIYRRRALRRDPAGRGRR